MLRWFSRALSDIDAQAAADRAVAGAQGDRDAAHVRQILVVGAALLALGYGVGDRPFFESSVAPWLRGILSRGARAWFDRYADLLSYVYWAWGKLIGYGLLPALHIKWMGGRLSDWGLSPRPRAGALPWRRTYLLLFAAIFPAVFVLSYTESFQATYPFYRGASRSIADMALWEAHYLATFAVVEFFFRGYLLFGLRRHLGSLTIFVSMVPYCMIHVLKPTSEALGSIVAGILLGTLALRTGTIWSGVLLHVSVALAMDLLSAWHGHGLPTRLWP